MECLVCKRLFSKSVVPLILSCGHTACNICVAKIQEWEFPCPHCARPFHGSIPNLSSCAQIKSDSQTNGAFCDICEEPHLATVKCIDCDQFLCNLMAQSHKVMNAVCHHKLVLLSELSAVDEDSVLLHLHPKKCSSHHRPYTHYNESIHGSHLLCVYCATEKAHLLRSHPSLPLSLASLSQQKVQETRAFSSKISERIASLTSTSQNLSDKIQHLDQSRDLALGRIQNTFQTYRQALDAREAELKGRVDELHKSARFEMEDEVERAAFYVGQLEQYAKGLEEMEKALTLAQNTFPSSLSSSSFLMPVPESLLVDVCLLEASLRASFSHSMEVEVSPTEGVEFRMSEEEKGWKEKMLELGTVVSISSPNSSSPHFELSDMNLISASDKGELEVVRALLDRGDDIHQKNWNGSTPLHLASENGHLPMISLLLDKGANIHEKDNDDRTPFYMASYNGHLPIVSLFLEKGANINEKNKDGLTPLHWASYNSHLEIVTLLLEKGANVNEKSKNGYAPLHFAIEKGHLPIITHLLDKGANINEKTNDGKTPLKLAQEKNKNDVVALLKKRGGWHLWI